MRALVILLLFIAVPAIAQIPDDNALNGIVNSYRDEASSWAGAIKGYAFTIFWLLVGIDFAWTGLGLVTKRADFGDWIGEYIHRIIVIGFFLALLQFSSTWATAIIDSLRQLAGIAGGISGLDPADVFDNGLIATGALMSKMSAFSPAKSLVLGIIGILMFVVFVLIAAELIFVLVTMWIILNAGIIMLAFGGSRWTQNFAVNYYRTVLAIGVKLFVIQLIIGVGLNIVINWAQSIPSTPSWNEIFTVAGSALILYVLVKSIGQLVESLISGSGAASASGSSAVSSAMMATAATVGAAAAMGASGVKGAAGAASGAKAAWEVAEEGLKQGSGMTAAQGALSAIGGAVAGGGGAAAGAKLGGMFSHVAGAFTEGTKAFGQDFRNQLKGDISAERGVTGGRMAEIMKDKTASMRRKNELDELGAGFSGGEGMTPVSETGTGGNAQPSNSGDNSNLADGGATTADTAPVGEGGSQSGIAGGPGPQSSSPATEPTGSSGTGGSENLAGRGAPASRPNTEQSSAQPGGDTGTSGPLPSSGYISGVPGQETMGVYADLEPSASPTDSAVSPGAPKTGDSSTITDKTVAGENLAPEPDKTS
ncbi:P-type conjugative transfer protein TrbL [Microbulbifer discodermiae]|uniref:P-type conjugative transfer protein TrbL n=1 Tax=Microbulbifer sp. 2201CG32-9 TaxID=3232309 RepID=UPI00345BCD0D